MNWTNEKPNESGYYWCLNSTTCDIGFITVTGFNEGHIYWPGVELTDSLEDFSGQFAGPIEKPKEPNAME